MKYTRNLTKLSLTDAPRTGNKGASLGEMLQAGIPVPPGFVILSSAFEKFLEESDLKIEIGNLLHKVDADAVHAVEKASNQIRVLVKAAKIPKHIVAEIQEAFRELDTRFVAVRSSATSEDSPSASWAGQLESYLNVEQKDLINRVQECWASLFTPRAIFYRFEKGFHTQDISVAVVIQKMVQAEVSGVAFSVHPVTQDTSTLIIEAGLGLGEALAQGTITPDTYAVEKKSRRVAVSNMRTSSKGAYQLLSKQHILQLADLVLRVESYFGFPVDIEWVFEDEKFYITQSRPVTTLQKVKLTNHQLKNIVLVGTRRTNQFEASLRARAWSDGLAKNLGYGFKTVVINSDGEHYVDAESRDKIDTLLQKKGVVAALEHIKKMYDIQSELLENIHNNIKVDFTEMFIDLFTEFFIARRIVEHVYEKAGAKVQRQINKWRNDSTLFEPLDLWHKQHPQEDVYDEWSIICTHEQIDIVPEKLSWQQSKFHEYRLREDIKESSIITGSPAWKGMVRGTVRVVFEKAQMGKVRRGDILVSPMTTLDFLPAMKKAAAFVTDEGGITSHAAIVAREMQKPCIVGTKIASRVLQDGMVVEIDADQGTVRILD